MFQKIGFVALLLTVTAGCVGAEDQSHTSQDLVSPAPETTDDPNTCNIDGYGQLSAGTYLLANQCLTCNPAQSTTNWTNLNCAVTGNYSGAVNCYQGQRCCLGAQPYTCEDWGRSSTRRYWGQNGVTEADGCGGSITCY